MASEKELNHLERIINNLNQHWHSIQLLLGYVSKPLMIDDRGLHAVLINITEKVKMMGEQLNLTIDSMKGLDIVQTLSEIKYIGNRLNNIEKILSEMQEKGIKKKVNLEISCDGYELVKKPMIYDPKDPIAKPQEALKQLLDKLTEKERIALIHRYGLFGESPKKLEKIGEMFGVTKESGRKIVLKAELKCRHLSRKKIFDLDEYLASMK